MSRRHSNRETAWRPKGWRTGSISGHPRPVRLTSLPLPSGVFPSSATLSSISWTSAIMRSSGHVQAAGCAPIVRAFDAGREEWTLTISSRDWDRRDEASKMDLTARLYSTFQGIRAEAGGDPKLAKLIIKSEDGEKLAECSVTGGSRVLK